jgi:multiple sugar transport system ATP-binding protein
MPKGEVYLEHISKKFGNVVAVDDVTLKVHEGEFFVLVGPSGCGKTTTLRIIAGLEKPDKGRVYIDGKDVTELPPKDRDCAMVFQDYALYPHMTVFDNIAFPLKLRKRPREEIVKEVRRVAELLHIDHLLKRYPHQLSGGEKQRVALARALVRQPRVFLMDEPLSNLDAKIRLYLRAELKALQRKLGVTTIYVTHDQAEALSLGDRVAVMNKGKLLQIDTPNKLFNDPRDVFVASFIGSPPTNLIKAKLIKQDDKIIFDFGDFKTYAENFIDERCADKLIKHVGEELILGIRPEYIKISTSPLKALTKVKVLAIEPLGSEYIITVIRGNDIIKIKTFSESEIEKIRGDEIWISIDFSKSYLFDTNGKRIYCKDDEL